MSNQEANCTCNCAVHEQDKKALLATVCAMLTDPPEYTYKHYGEQDG